MYRYIRIYEFIDLYANLWIYWLICTDIFELFKCTVELPLFVISIHYYKGWFNSNLPVSKLEITFTLIFAKLHSTLVIDSKSAFVTLYELMLSMLIMHLAQHYITNVNQSWWEPSLIRYYLYLGRNLNYHNLFHQVSKNYDNINIQILIIYSTHNILSTCSYIVILFFTMV
jgi:hypothetical protein